MPTIPLHSPARPSCECTAVCGEDPGIATGRVRPCAARLDEFRQRAQQRSQAPSPPPSTSPPPTTAGDPDMSAFTPHPGSVADKVISFLRSNPTVASLTATEIAETYKVKQAEVSMYLVHAVDARVLARLGRYGNRDITFSRGAKFAPPASAPAAAPAPAEQASAPSIKPAEARQVAAFVKAQPERFREPYDQPGAAVAGEAATATLDPTLELAARFVTAMSGRQADVRAWSADVAAMAATAVDLAEALQAEIARRRSAALPAIA